MKKLHKARLEKLAAFLDELPKAKFDFSEVVHEIAEKDCAAVACAIGWCPRVFPRLAQWRLDDEDPIDPILTVRARRGGVLGPLNAVDQVKEVAAAIFEMSREEAVAVFIANPWPRTDWIRQLGDISEEATPKQVARRIRKFIKLKEMADAKN